MQETDCTKKQEEYLCINIKTFNISIYPLYTVFFWSVVKSTKVNPQYKTTPLTQHTVSNIHSCLTRPPGGVLVAELHEIKSTPTPRRTSIALKGTIHKQFQFVKGKSHFSFFDCRGQKQPQKTNEVIKMCFSFTVNQLSLTSLRTHKTETNLF